MPEQENSPTFKEFERNGKDEFTEFEKTVADCCIRYRLTTEGTFNELIKDLSKVLLSSARKRIASEIDIDAMVEDFFEENTTYTSFYRQGIEDLLKKIKEG